MEISTCCGVCSLRTGTIIIGILNLVFGVLSLIIGSLVTTGVFFNYQLELKSIGGGMISYILMVFILALLLIVGAVEKKANYVFPFTYLSFGHVIAFIGSSIAIIIAVCMIPGVPGTIIFTVFFSLGVGSSFNIYLWLILHSFYQELMIEKVLQGESLPLSPEQAE